MGGPALKRLQHPFAILYNLRQFIWALVIPLARGLVSALSDGGIPAWISGAWIDLVTLFGMLLFSLLMWMACSYEVDETGLSVRHGLIVHTSTFIPAAQTATLSAVYAFYLRPFGAVRLRADTLAGSRERADLSLFVSKEEARAILDGRVAELKSGTLSRRYRPRSLYVAALAAFSSSSFAGMIFLATLISRTGELLGAEFKSRVYGTFERVTQLLAFGIPPAAAAVGYILLFGWLVAFSINFIRHKNLVVCRRGGALHIRGGVFTSREYVVAANQINYLDIRQTVLSFFLRFCTVHINAVGYSKYSDDVSGVIPAVRVRDAARTLGLVFPEWKPVPRQLRHNWGALFKFIGDASWGCLLIPAAAFFLRWLIPSWGSFIGWVGFMLCFPAYWFLMIRLIDYFTSGIARDGDRLTLRYSSGYYLHTIILPIDRIAWVCLRQSPIQAMDKKCDVLLYSYAEHSTRHHIRNLDRQAVRDLLGLEL